MEAFKFDANVAFYGMQSAYPGVLRVCDYVRSDMELIFDKQPALHFTDDILSIAASKAEGLTVIFGTLAHDDFLNALTDACIIHRDELEGKREVYEIARIPESFGDIGNAVVVCGSDKRGTIYGLLRLSEYMGVSPFVDFSGVLPKKCDSIAIGKDLFGISREPSVRYRGIFINDEWPAFGNWATKRFGGVNAECYSHVFQMILRLKGNYMWPAMWATNFSMDGPGILAAELADELGIVMSTSHHEPCMRTGEEYSLLRGKDSPYGDAWDFISNREGITRFWEDGLKRNAPFENVYTMGMRGERDTAIMANASLAENIALLRDIFKTQNELLRKYVNPDLTKIPRQLVLFTEVEKFFYGDEETPGLITDPELDGVTVMFSDDNYGYTRTLPTEKMLSHNGGYGMYYHVDMHGGAYSYEWIGSTYLPRIWDQLSTTYDYGVDRIWVVNVGDICTQELEISYIMAMANDMDRYGSAHPNNCEEFVHNWVKTQFGAYFDEADLSVIERVIWNYTLILERRKHEIMNLSVYHPRHFSEAEDLYKLSDSVLSDCEYLLKSCPRRVYTGFYELIYYPAVGTANLMKTWIASLWNQFEANQNRNSANDWNDVIDEGIVRDRKLIDEFHSVGDGKFYGQGLSEHFGFRFWNNSNNQMPLRIYCYPANLTRMLISKKDSADFFDGKPYTRHEMYVNDFLRPDVKNVVLEVSCGSRDDITYTVETDSDLLRVYGPTKAGADLLYSPKDKGECFDKDAATFVTGKTDYFTVEVDREALCEETDLSVTFTCGEDFVKVIFAVCPVPTFEFPAGTFVEYDGYIAMEANHFAEKVVNDEAWYEVLTPYGITGAGVKMYPNRADARELRHRPYLTYRFACKEAGEYEAIFCFAPSTPVIDVPEQLFAHAVNGDIPTTVDTVWDPDRPFFNGPQWNEEARNNVKKAVCKIECRQGLNTLQYYQISPNLILERIVLVSAKAPLPESYLGPKESYRLP